MSGGGERNAFYTRLYDDVTGQAAYWSICRSADLLQQSETGSRIAFDTPAEHAIEELSREAQVVGKS
jgi:hypothetical protein